MRRRRDGTLVWSGRRQDLLEGERPDFVVVRADNVPTGVEVTETIDSSTSRSAGYDDELSAAMRAVLDAHGGGGFVAMQVGSRPPFEDRGIRTELVARLGHDINAAGGLEKFIAALPHRRWEFHWTAQFADGDRGGRKFVGFDFAPLPEARRWRVVGGLVTVMNRPTLDPAEIDVLIRARVLDKASKAREYAETPGGLHVLVVNPFEPLVPSQALLDAVADAIRASNVTEVWLLNHDPVVLDAAPPEPFISRLA